MHPASPSESFHSILQSTGRSAVRIRIWRLQYGPCWCHGIPSDSGSFTFARMRTTSADFGLAEENLLIVSGRVLDGTKGVFLRLYSDIPEPTVVISAPACPAAQRFWDELPVGWTPVEEVIPVHIRVEHCIWGNPEELMAAALSHFLTREGQPNSAPRITL